MTMTKETCSNCPTKETCNCATCSVVDKKCNRNECPINTFCKHKDKPLDNGTPDVIKDLFGFLRGKKE
jgi:hypothetical protein